MKHLYFFYFFTTFFVGAGSLSVAGALYIRTKETVLQYYLYFYAAFTSLIVLNAVLMYLSANIPTIPPNLFGVLEYLESPVAQYLVMLTVPMFVHAFFGVPSAKLRNLILGSIVLTLYIGYHVIEYVLAAEGRLEFAGELIEDVVFMVIMLYSFITALAYYRNLQDDGRKRFAKKFLILFGIFFPGILNDTFLSEVSEVRFYPILYGGVSFLFTHHFIKQYLQQYRNSQQVLPEQPLANPLPDDDFFARYDISAREKEVILLIVQGCSYREIGERLYISLNTVKTHIRSIYPKFGVNSRHELTNLLRHTQREPTDRSETSEC